MKKSSTPPPRFFSWSGNMKRAIVIEILLLFVLGVLILGDIALWDMTIRRIYIGIYDPQFLKGAYICLFYCIIISLGTIADIAAIVLVALNEYPAFKPLIDKLKGKLKFSKKERKQAKKQTRIEKLQDELDELKKDE